MASPVPARAPNPARQPAPTSAAVDLIRARLGDRYALERELGRGGMGTVYLAQDLRLQRPVALKVLPPEFATQVSLRERFLLETRTAASFSHPNIVPVYAVEESEDLLAYAMGLVEGETLTDRVSRGGPLTVRETVKILQDVGYALAYAHGRGVVHRDVKPDNIMLDRASGRALVMDFGISRSIVPSVPGSALTRVGEVVGTPEYMSPEQASGDRVDGRSDLYALGLTAYFAATGKVTMAAETTQKVLVRQLTETVPSMSTLRPDFPPVLTDAIDRCVQKDPEHRFATAEALVDALDAGQLAEPEIPLAIRLFAGEVSGLSTVTLGILLFSLYVLQTGDAAGRADLDVILPVIMLLAVLLTRVLTTLGEARRIASAGFSVDDIITGFSRVVAERDHRREELRADPEVRRRRRMALGWALALLPSAALMFWIAFRMRVEVAPGMYSVGLLGSLMAMSAFAMLGIGMVLLVKSPFRVPPGERLFRRVWLKAPGRFFLRMAARGAHGGSPRSSRPGIAVPPRQTAPSGVRARARTTGDAVNAHADDRLSAIEKRVARLEDWRDGSA